MSSAARVSIIIPLYNGGKYLPEAVASAGAVGRLSGEGYEFRSPCFHYHSVL